MIKSDTQILTILIPCYNAEKYVSRCTSSLERLSYNDISLLFINDGSNDSTENLIGEWVNSHCNARMISKENGGYSTAINMGLDNCQTDYVMFMGIDDEIIPESLNEICERLRQSQPDVLAFSTEKVYDDDGDSTMQIDPITKYKHPGFYKNDVFSLFRKYGNDVGMLFTRDTSRCFRMTTIGNVRYFGKTGVSADGCFSSMVSFRSNSFEFVNKSCYLWHLHKDSVSSRNKSIDKLIEELEVWYTYFREIKPKILHQKIPDPIINQYFVYKKLINRLRDMNESKIADLHQGHSDDFIKWVYRNSSISIKARIKLACQMLCTSFRSNK